MLILSRRTGEDIIIDVNGIPVVVRLIEMRDACVRLGFQAPRSIPVNRREVWEQHHAGEYHENLHLADKATH